VCGVITNQKPKILVDLRFRVTLILRRAPLVCVSDVIELLDVWLYNKPKTQNNCARSCCTWRADCVDSKPNKKKEVGIAIPTGRYVPLVVRET